jgi:hypothetical protein
MKKIEGQVRYMGPTIAGIGLHYGHGFTNGIYDNWYQFIEQCPAIGQMFIPAERVASVRRELNFDYARNLRGTTGKHVAFYKEIQNWLAERAKKQQPSEEGVKVKHHA